MSSSFKVSALLGSLRHGSYSKRLALTLAEVAPLGMTVEILELGDLPIFNEDLETDTPPPSWTRLRQSIRASDALLFITPEYNRSIPAVLKNAIDVGSSPYGQSVWDNKPGAIVSFSIGAMGGFGANHHLRQALVFTNVPVMSQPEAYIGGVDTLFEGDGDMPEGPTRAFLAQFMGAFLTWTSTHLAESRDRAGS
jgi:chromate reductase